MLLAVPLIMLIACSTSLAFKSTIFISAISFTCFDDTFPTFVLWGTPEPFSSPDAFSSSTAAGGVFVTNVNDLSEYTVITTGIINPFLSCVLALNCLQNSMPFTPL